MAPFANFVSLLPLLGRAAQAPKPKAAYITVTTESQSPCTIHADGMPWPVHSFGSNKKVNATCWTTSTMQDSKGELNTGAGYTYLWIQTNGSFGEPAYSSRPGVGNADQGGKASGEGCWLHEDGVKGGNIDFHEALEWCGPAPHHQIATPFYNVAMVCRNCTDLTNATCQKEYPTTAYGYVDVGCWKKGTEVKGNSTWVKVLGDSYLNDYGECYVSPDQWDPKEWHGLPAGQCKD